MAAAQDGLKRRARSLCRNCVVGVQELLQRLAEALRAVRVEADDVAHQRLNEEEPEQARKRVALSQAHVHGGTRREDAVHAHSEGASSLETLKQLDQALGHAHAAQQPRHGQRVDAVVRLGEVKEE